MRIVQGGPTSWDSPIAAVKRPGLIGPAAWSPCGRFIANYFHKSESAARVVEILDAVTLDRLQVFTPLSGYTQLLAFSAEGRWLTQFSDKPEAAFTSWDLHTGVPVSAISPITWICGQPEVFTG